MKANIPTSTSRVVKWATAFSAIAISLLAWTASAKDEVPTKEALSGYTISATQNPDGSQDILFGVVGVSTHSGRFNGLGRTHVEPVNPGQQYDPATHALRIPFTARGTYTAANGDTHDWTAEGVVIVPLDASFMPLPPPMHFTQPGKSSAAPVALQDRPAMELAKASATLTGPLRKFTAASYQPSAPIRSNLPVLPQRRRWNQDSSADFCFRRRRWPIAPTRWKMSPEAVHGSPSARCT